MKNTLLAGVLLAIGAWTAGASAQPQPVTVTLVNNQIPDVAPIVVEQRMGPNVVIRWQLPPDADYSFDPTGIAVNGEKTRGGGLRAQDQLPPTCHGGPKHVTCLNKNTKRGEFKYTIRLLDRGRNLVTLDPLIVNR